MPKIVIIGGGPAGLSAAIYASRANLETTVLYTDGGALGKTDKLKITSASRKRFRAQSCSRADRRRQSAWARRSCRPRPRASSMRRRDLWSNPQPVFFPRTRSSSPQARRARCLRLQA